MVANGVPSAFTTDEEFRMRTAGDGGRNPGRGKKKSSRMVQRLGYSLQRARW